MENVSVAERLVAGFPAVCPMPAAVVGVTLRRVILLEIQCRAYSLKAY